MDAGRTTRQTSTGKATRLLAVRWLALSVVTLSASSEAVAVATGSDSPESASAAAAGPAAGLPGDLRESPANGALGAGVRAAASTLKHAGLVDWALSRFEAAGLDAPESTVVFEPGSPRCGGFVGRYYADTDTAYVCVSEGASDRVKRSVLLHELSHAWAEHHVSDQTREEFGRLRGTRSWNGARDGWGQRATEHAAVIMAWGLADGITNVHLIGDMSANALAEAFQFLTGTNRINDGSTPSPEATRPNATLGSTRLS